MTELILIMALIYIVLITVYLYARYKAYEPDEYDDDEQAEYLKEFSNGRDRKNQRK